MKKSLAGGVGVAAAVVVLFGAAPAGAVNEYVGQTYEKAASSIKAGGGTAVISSREGSYLPTDKCVVTGSRNSTFLDSSGRKQGTKILLDLNCNDIYAGKSGHPGNSGATAQGQRVMRFLQTAKLISEDYAEALANGRPSWCEENVESCKYQCEQAETCSAEVKEFLGL